MDPNLESSGAGQHAGEPNAALGGLGGGDRLMENKSAAAPSATSGPREKKLTAPREQMALPNASKSMVGPTIRPPSPWVVPPAIAEEDEVEEIEREEPRTQSVRILQKCDNDIVVVEEEDTTKEFRRLETSIFGVMKQIKVSTVSEEVLVDVWNWMMSLSLCICRR